MATRVLHFFDTILGVNRTVVAVDSYPEPTPRPTPIAKIRRLAEEEAKRMLLENVRAAVRAQATRPSVVVMPPQKRIAPPQPRVPYVPQAKPAEQREEGICTFLGCTATPVPRTQGARGRPPTRCPRHIKRKR